MNDSKVDYQKKKKKKRMIVRSPTLLTAQSTGVRSKKKDDGLDRKWPPL